MLDVDEISQLYLRLDRADVDFYFDRAVTGRLFDRDISLASRLGLWEMAVAILFRRIG